MFLKNRNIRSKIKRSKVTDYAALISVSNNVITGASAFPVMSLLLIGNTVSEHEEVNPTTEPAAMCLKRVAEAQFYVALSQCR